MSAASGAVGALVGQLAVNVASCIAIGSCGSAAKCAHIKELGFQHAIEYKNYPTADALIGAIRAVAPDGIDMDFENVGGIHFDASFRTLRTGGRIAVCGAISQYNTPGAGLGGAGNNINIGSMIYTSQRIEGFISSTYLKKGTWLPAMSAWLREGKIKVRDCRQR